MDKEQPESEKINCDDEAVWARDQQKRSYYYDDAHGYEIYNPDEDDENDENDEEIISDQLNQQVPPLTTNN